MFIQTEDTPNPATMKFLPGRDVLGAACDPVEIVDIKAADVSPLAQALFTAGGIKGVFLGRDFITVTREDGAEWAVLKPSLLAAIAEHYDSGKPALLTESGKEKSNKDDGEVVRQIKELLDTKIRPAVAQDGGDITFHSFEDGVVYLTLRGACAGCPSATATLKSGVENMLRHFIPEVREVRQRR